MEHVCDASECLKNAVTQSEDGEKLCRDHAPSTFDGEQAVVRQLARVGEQLCQCPMGPLGWTAGWCDRCERRTASLFGEDAP